MIKKIYAFILLFTLIVSNVSIAQAKNNKKVSKEDYGIELIEYGKGIHIFKVMPIFKTSLRKKYCNQVIPYVTESLETNNSIYNNTSCTLCVNGGFFDFKNNKTVSRVIIDGELVADPRDNESLADNKSLAPYLEKIYNRGEFRVLKSKNRIKYDIAYPNSPVEKGYELIHALQAGPIVLPNLDLEKEFFIVKKDKQIVRQSASVLNKKARTVIGLKNQEDNIYIIIIEQNSGMDIFEVKSLCKKLGLTKALNLDGGGSTSLHYEDINITSENKPNGRKIKSFLLINTFKI